MIHLDENFADLPPNSEGVPNRVNGDFLSIEQVILTVLDNAGEGIFFLNREYEIYRYYSAALESILSIKDLENKNFISLLENRVPEQVINNVREYLELMYREDLDEEVINELNPLIDTEFFYEDEWGMWTSSKYLSFKFQRVLENDKILKLIGVVKDDSERNVLSRKLEQTENHTQKQMEWLVNILHVEPELLKDFFIGVEHELHNIELVLKNGKDTQKPQELLENIYRSLYIIKGNASLLDLRFFTDKTTQFIEKVMVLKGKKNLSGTDFVPVVVLLGDMQDTLKDVHTIFKRISHFHNHFRAKRTYESELLVNSLRNLTRGLSKQLGKDVIFDYKDFDALSIPYMYRQLVRDVLFLLIRNAILYGIEDSDQRKSNNKSPSAVIKISSIINNGLLGLVLRHDGRIDRIERLLQKLINFDEEDVEKRSDWEGMQVTQLLFMPNIQTGDEKELLTNYSMDIEALKKKLKEKKGRLKITFTSEESCEFTVLFPLNHV
jgi:two-component system chemotaxis sensor kinase CheA